MLKKFMNICIHVIELSLMKALVIGATGAVGSEVVKQLLEAKNWKLVRVLARSPQTFTHNRLEWHQGNLQNDEFISAHLDEITHIFMCIGTTKKKTSDKEEYKSIDYGIPVRTAELAEHTDVFHMLVVSAIGANPKSPAFYSKLKGEMERDVSASAVPRIDFFRPSTIIAYRDEKRPLEELAIRIDRLLAPIIPLRYKAVHAAQIAKAMLIKATEIDEGRYIVSNKEIHQISKL